ASKIELQNRIIVIQIVIYFWRILVKKKSPSCLRDLCIFCLKSKAYFFLAAFLAAFLGAAFFAAFLGAAFFTAFLGAAFFAAFFFVAIFLEFKC
ncbi:MAG: hypothetical protein ACOYLO_14395, partial [Ferruginibacter sp.]